MSFIVVVKLRRLGTGRKVTVHHWHLNINISLLRGSHRLRRGAGCDRVKAILKDGCGRGGI